MIGLSLHVGKTECVLFASKQRIQSVANLDIKYDGRIIKVQNTVKYSGVQIDKCITGGAMTSSVIDKVLGKPKYLYRNTNCLKQSLRKTRKYGLSIVPS